jgi:hypothetical protein
LLQGERWSIGEIERITCRSWRQAKVQRHGLGSFLRFMDCLIVVKALNDLHAREISVSVDRTVISVSVDRTVNVMFRYVAASRFGGDLSHMFSAACFAPTADFIGAAC